MSEKTVKKFIGTATVCRTRLVKDGRYLEFIDCDLRSLPVGTVIRLEAELAEAEAKPETCNCDTSSSQCTVEICGMEKRSAAIEKRLDELEREIITKHKPERCNCDDCTAALQERLDEVIEYAEALTPGRINAHYSSWTVGIQYAMEELIRIAKGEN